MVSRAFRQFHIDNILIIRNGMGVDIGFLYFFRIVDTLNREEDWSGVG